MATLDIDGARLVYDIEGDGDQTLAFVHGWCSKSAHWDAQAQAFGSTHRIVRWDRRGMGRSQADEPARSPARHADDLAAILDAAEMRHMGGDTATLARQVTCPVLWVSAQPDDTASVSGLFADLTVGHVVGSGHFVQLEVPDQLNAMVAAFLADKVSALA